MTASQAFCTACIILALCASAAQAAEPAESESPAGGRRAVTTLDSPKADASPVGDSFSFHARSALGYSDGRDAGGDLAVSGSTGWATLTLGLYYDALASGGSIGLRAGGLIRNDDPWFCGIHAAAGSHDESAALAADQWAACGVRVGYMLRGGRHRGGSWLQLAYEAPGARLFWCVVADLGVTDWLRLRGVMLWSIGQGRRDGTQAYEVSALFGWVRLGVSFGEWPLWMGRGVTTGGAGFLANGVVSISLEVAG